jgi:hypothetical protein
VIWSPMTRPICCPSFTASGRPAREPRAEPLRVGDDVTETEPTLLTARHPSPPPRVVGARRASVEVVLDRAGREPGPARPATHTRPRVRRRGLRLLALLRLEGDEGPLDHRRQVDQLREQQVGVRPAAVLLRSSRRRLRSALRRRGSPGSPCGGGFRRHVLDQHPQPPVREAATPQVEQVDAAVVGEEVGLYRLRVLLEEVAERLDFPRSSPDPACHAFTRSWIWSRSGSSSCHADSYVPSVRTFDAHSSKSPARRAA